MFSRVLRNKVKLILVGLFIKFVNTFITGDLPIQKELKNPTLALLLI
jgi:hypothetical protein